MNYQLDLEYNEYFFLGKKFKAEGHVVKKDASIKFNLLSNILSLFLS